ncbi:unnamed protein product [Zymoseptoria tritici ST99CH_3D1]|uniref:Uncharacterized protein n=1 Tax=Zymoseptoria tritici ST99CH_1E4 TaxID=1276532 RepID=A0A2H1G639_ZYMTR|nr:unnamed protein product [Zymoseptoria tritici ST99CH_1E4]SMR50208.1 unnamed protein product [Zymoseptoria tritici ST99CH_3D1]
MAVTMPSKNSSLEKKGHDPRTLELLQGMGAQFTKDQKADKKAQDIAKKPACTVKNTHSVNTSVRRK